MTKQTFHHAYWAIFLFAFQLGLPSDVNAEELQIQVAAGKHDRQNAVCQIALAGENFKAGQVVMLENAGGQVVAVGDISQPRILAEQTGSLLTFVLPELKAGATLKLTIKTSEEKPLRHFTWTESDKVYTQLNYAGRPVLRYMHESLDNSSKERREETYKVYHHVFDPRGETLLTKGPGGLYPHHRGLFYGFNRISYGDNKAADVWHCNKGESQTHEEIVSAHAGPTLGRHVLRIDWNGQDAAAFAEETRELTAYQVPGGLLIEFASRLHSKVGPLVLDGDPQHAGFQFRATQLVPDKTAKLTYYVRPDGKGEAGKFRNWPANKDFVDLPWNALCFVVNDQRYTCCYLDRPGNPKEARFSERDYGRFGSYFKTEIEGPQTLDVNYRIWLQEGEMTVAEVQKFADDFVEPPQVSLLK